MSEHGDGDSDDVCGYVKKNTRDDEACEEDEPESPCVASGLKAEQIDDLTMKLLVNKTQYNKWLAKNEPSKYDEREKFFEKMRLRKNQLSGIFERLMDSPREIVATDVNETFEDFVAACILHIDNLGQQQQQQHRHHRTEDVTAFCDMDEEDPDTAFNRANNKHINDYSFVMRNFNRRQPF
jgi:hypothetical protein